MNLFAFSAMSATRSTAGGKVWLRLPNWIGDVCMALPALQLLQSQGLTLQLVGRSWVPDLLAGWSTTTSYSVQGKFWSDLNHLRQNRNTSQIDKRRSQGLLLPNSWSSAALFTLSGIASAGYATDARGWLLRWPIPKPAAPQHEVRTFFALARAALCHWGADENLLPATPPPNLGLVLSPAHCQQIQTLLQQYALTKFILLGPTAIGLHQGQNKVWPHFGALIQALTAAGHTVVLCPPATERAALRASHPAFETAVWLPPLPLGAFAGLCAAAEWVVCNDSGVSHLASAVNARQITLFGATHPERTGPWSSKAKVLGRYGHWPNLAEVMQALSA